MSRGGETRNELPSMGKANGAEYNKENARTNLCVKMIFVIFLFFLYLLLKFVHPCYGAIKYIRSIDGTF